MRAVIQRVRRASVAIAGSEHAAIGPGLLVLVGIAPGDTAEDSTWLAGKIVRLRIFPAADDASGKMTASVADCGGEILAISQFTLFAETQHGNRPSFAAAAPPDEARAGYARFLDDLAAALGQPVRSGVFAADMQVELINDGPVTICLDSRAR